MSAQEAPVGYTNGTTFKWNTRGQTIAAATVLPAVGLICVILRFWSRLHKRTGFGLDDAFVLPALLCVIGLGITLLVGVAKNVIAHSTPPNPNAANSDAQLYQITGPQELVEKIEFTFFLLTVAAYGFIKLSVLFFYRRIFVKGTSTTFDIATKIAVGITLAWTIAFFLAQLFMCGRYVDYQWGPLIDLSSCLDGFKYNDALFISDLITDLVVICLPIPLILQLHMTIQRKLATIGVMLLGAISIVAALIRIVYNYQTQAGGLALATDVDEALTTILYWGMLEAGISLIATNLPSLYFLVTKNSLQSFAASIRSQVSLNSLRSDKPKLAALDPPVGSKRQNGSIAPVAPVAGENGREDVAGYNTDHTMDVREPRVIHNPQDMRLQGDMV